MKNPTESTTRSEAVYVQLRSDLLRGEYKPGAKLRIAELGGRYGCSPSVVREVLSRLTQQALAVSIPQRGFAMPELTSESLRDLRQARIMIETMALRESIREGGIQWESNVMAALHRLDRIPQVDDEGHITAAWESAHNHFHNTLLAGGPSSVLMEVAIGLRERSQLFVHWSRELVDDRERDVPAEHRLITQRALARDADGATAALEIHIERSAGVLLEYVVEPVA